MLQLHVYYYTQDGMQNSTSKSVCSTQLISLHQGASVNTKKPNSSKLLNSLKLEIIFYMYVECTVHACSINIGELSEAASMMN